jgi:hypothetical protein
MLGGHLASRTRSAIAAIAIAALLPYTVLKVLWLADSRIGMVPGSGYGHMQDARMEIGNGITILAVGVGIAVVLALVQDWGMRLSWWVLVLPAAGATGALAPIALGLPFGVLLQTLVDGNMSTGGEGNLEGPVFSVVYGGFAVFGIALSVLFVDYVGRRWSTVIASGPKPPRERWIILAAIAGMVPFALGMLFWAFPAPGTAGLDGWQSIAQRMVLVVIALLTLVGLITPLLPRLLAAPPVRAWLTVWVGCCTAAVQGPILLLLAHDAVLSVPLLVLAALATPAAVLFGLAVLRRSSETVPAATPAQHGRTRTRKL